MTTELIIEGKVIIGVRGEKWKKKVVRTVVVPESVDTIGCNAFSSCSLLTSLV